MRTTRSRLSTVAVMALVATLAACGNSADGPSDSDAGAPADGPISGDITVWTWDGAPGADAMDALAAGFEKETGVKVNSKVVSRDDYTAQVQLALNSGEDIDVLGVQPSQFATEVEPKMRPVSEYADQLAETSRLVADAAGAGSHSLVYQSRSGSPQVPWLEPDVERPLVPAHDIVGDRDVAALRRDDLDRARLRPRALARSALRRPRSHTSPLRACRRWTRSARCGHGRPPRRSGARVQRDVSFRSGYFGARKAFFRTQGLPQSCDLPVQQDKRQSLLH